MSQGIEEVTYGKACQDDPGDDKAVALPTPKPRCLRLWQVVVLSLAFGLFVGFQVGRLLDGGVRLRDTTRSIVATTTTAATRTTPTITITTTTTTTTPKTAVAGHTTGVAGPFPALAVVISGQVARFVYKESLARVSRMFRSVLDCKGDHAGCKGAVDVYVVLGDTRTSAWAGDYGTPPYVQDVLKRPERVRDYYLAKSASRFSLKVYSQSECEAMVRAMEGQVAAAGSRATGASPEAFRATWGRYGRRWPQNRGMYLLRHLAYAAALDGERSLPYKYSHFLVLREDNAFLHDVDLRALLRRLDGRRDERLRKVPQVPSVLVDAKCGWGSFSDKLWLANRGAADLLFGRSDEDHTNKLATLLVGGSYMKRRTPVIPEEQLQPEYFYQYLLETAGARVEKVEFGRTDLRYLAGQPCVPGLYHH
mmetsp:Transcript_61611/g.123488  ORF Transcript_61611/g.123488 Transcript_61611/m.123488 type:complete len:422 (-) Transcript_61611:66-1331(-)